MKLPEAAKVSLASGRRWAAVLIGILAAPLLFFFSPSSTAVFGTPQASNAGNHRGFSPLRADDERAYFLSSSHAEGGLSSPPIVIPTRENLQLTLRADCADIEIFTDATNEVSYDFHVNPRVAGADANTVLRDLSLTARNTPRGVALLGRESSGSDCGARATYEIHVPRHYNLNIAIQSGDITSQDVEGLITFATGGGNIRAGRVGMGDSSRAIAGERFAAKLETGGGDISAGDIAGGLRAATAGGQISAADIHGPAVLSTGGGDIRVGHVFGEARFTSGGGDIIAEKVDGGVWADTAGGRIVFGDKSGAARIAPRFPAGEREAFLAAPGDPRNQSGIPGARGLLEISQLERLFDPLLWGGIPVDPADQQKRLLSSIVPEYPDVARLAGIDGDVTLRILVAGDGSVRGITAISGPPVLARAAMHAVERWRYVPALVNGRPVDVVTTVRLAFRLRP